MSDVFISYSRKDIAFARLLHASLANSQIDTWIDWERIPIGEKWWDEITHAIENANVFMFIISKNSIGSTVCKDEIKLALKNNKRVIPIVVDAIAEDMIRDFAPELPQFNWIIFEKDDLFQLKEQPDLPGRNLEDRQIASARLPQFDEALQRLSDAIHTDWEWVRYHTQLQVQALLWDKNERNTGYLLGGSAIEEAESQLFRASGREPSTTELQVDFVTESRKAETERQHEKLRLEQKASQRQRMAIISILAGFVFSLILGGVAWGQRNQYLRETIVRATAEGLAVEQKGIADGQRQVAEEQRDIAEEQRNQVVSRQLATQGLYDANKRFDLALLLGLEADRRAEGAAWARSSLLQILQTSPRLQSFTWGHSQDVSGVVLSPDSTMMVTASLDETIQFWDIRDPNSPIKIGDAPLLAHQGGVTTLAIHPDGSILATGGKDKFIRLWDIRDPKLPVAIGKPFTDHTDGVNSVAFSPDGSILASGGADGVILLWDVADPKAPQRLGNPLTWILGPVLNITFSPDGRLLAPITFNKIITSVYLWDISDPLNPISYPNINTSQTDAIAFHPTRNYLASGKMDGTVTFWDLSNPGSLVKIGSIPSDRFVQVTSLSFDPEGRILAVGDSKNMITLWNVTSPESPQRLDEPLIGHTSRVSSMFFSANGKLLASGSWDNSALLWDVSDETMPLFLGRRLLANDLVMDVVFSASGSDLLAGIQADQTPVEEISEWVMNEVFNPEKNVKKYGGLAAWDVTDPILAKQILTFDGPEIGNITAMGLQPQNSLLALATSDKKIQFWDISDVTKPIMVGQPFLGHSRAIEDMAISKDGKMLVSSSSAYEVILWDIRDPLKYRPISNSFVGISVAFSPDSSILAVASDKNTIRFWKIADQGIPSQISSFTSSEKMDVNKMVFTKDGKALIGGCLDGSLVILDMTNPTEITQVGKIIPAHTGFIYGLDISPDGQLVAVGSSDEDVSVWNISDLEAPFQVGLTLQGHKNSVYDVAFSPDGKSIASGSGDASVIQWNFDLDALPEYACTLVGRNLTVEEWSQFLPVGEQYRKTCTDLP